MLHVEAEANEIRRSHEIRWFIHEGTTSWPVAGKVHGPADIHELDVITSIALTLFSDTRLPVTSPSRQRRPPTGDDRRSRVTGSVSAY
jgi:hypothetical protein